METTQDSSPSESRNMEKQRYELMTSIHYEINPDFQGKHRHHPDRLIMYKQGAIIESERPLDKIYVNKFRKVVERDEPVVVTEERKLQVAQLIAVGSWGEDDRLFLENLSADGFTRITRQAGLDQKKSGTEERKKVMSVLGEEVTDSFQRAYDEGFKVFRNPAGKHQVTRGVGNVPLNKAPLDAEKVDEFVGKYLKESK